eukprot:TRINITY_DN9179_c0_g2_i1.p1 TRINITY_DN9179_c0_g2~~TRINITY_DN9179_c0_g2_i1.p1  ORF type:complete len:216 (-),score=48.85 TRINITY_DN9179_c0_g2_i1:72-719(-)
MTDSSALRHMSFTNASQLTDSPVLSGLFASRSGVFDPQGPRASPQPHHAIVSKQGSKPQVLEAPLAKFHEQDFGGIYDILAKSSDQEGKVGVRQLTDFHREIHECTLDEQQVEYAMNKLTGGDEEYINKGQFLDLVVDLHNRCVNMASLRWDFEMFDPHQTGVISEDSARQLFRAAPSYSDDKFKRWSSERPNPDAKVTLEEAYNALTWMHTGRK